MKCGLKLSSRNVKWLVLLKYEIPLPQRPTRFLNILYKIEHWLWPELILMWTLLLGPSLNKSDCSLCSRQNCRRLFKHRMPSAGAHLRLFIYLWGARFTLIFFLHVLFASLVGTYTLIFLQCFSKKRSRVRLHCEDIGFFRALHSLHRRCPLWSPLPSSPMQSIFCAIFSNWHFWISINAHLRRPRGTYPPHTSEGIFSRHCLLARFLHF